MVNLQFHHKFYDELDEKQRSKHGAVSRQMWEIKRMLNDGINPKKKFALLCQQCNSLEGWIKVSPAKAFELFSWLAGEGYFDEVFKDDPSLKKLTNFMKN